MSEKDIQPITDPREIPEGLSDEEQIAFWETHAITEEYLVKTEEVPIEERPQPRSSRTRPVSIRFNDDTINRLKALAEVKGGVGYQTLIKEFVDQRLYEEEKREGILPPNIQQTVEEVLDDVYLKRAQSLDYLQSAITSPPSMLTHLIKGPEGVFFDTKVFRDVDKLFQETMFQENIRRSYSRWTRYLRDAHTSIALAGLSGMQREGRSRKRNKDRQN